MGTSGQTHDAIHAALNGDWSKAIKINTSLLKKSPKNINILNRLGFAYLKAGKKTKAKQTFQKVIELDEYNSIAQKNLLKLNTLKGSKIKNDVLLKSNTTRTFIEEPGITKSVLCINLAPADTLANTSPGQEVFLQNTKRCVEVRNEKKVFLGALPDDISYRISKLIQGGNVYKTYIKTIGKNTLCVLIREISRGKKFKDQPSFIKTKLSKKRRRRKSKK